MACGTVVLQQPVDEHVATTDFAQQEALGGIVQEIRITPGCNAVAEEQETEHKALEACTTAVLYPQEQSEEQPADQRIAGYLMYIAIQNGCHSDLAANWSLGSSEKRYDHELSADQPAHQRPGLQPIEGLRPGQLRPEEPRVEKHAAEPADQRTQQPSEQRGVLKRLTHGRQGRSHLRQVVVDLLAREGLYRQCPLKPQPRAQDLVIRDAATDLYGQEPEAEPKGVDCLNTRLAVLRRHFI